MESENQKLRRRQVRVARLIGRLRTMRSADEVPKKGSERRVEQLRVRLPRKRRMDLAKAERHYAQYHEPERESILHKLTGTRSEVTFLDETPVRACRSALIVACARHPEDVPDHDVLVRRDVLLELRQVRNLVRSPGIQERHKVLPAVHALAESRPVPADPNDVASRPKLHQRSELDRTYRDFESLVNVESIDLQAVTPNNLNSIHVELRLPNLDQF